ncbi:ANTAR domain protein [Mycobacteroides abscessus 21]|nr:ANTAR domain protein [Mycobacteroides abscessus 21]
MIDDSGEVVGTEGFYIDVTDGLQSDITTETSRILKSRSIIDQAKGVLMVAYGIDDARAFEVLKLSSQLAQVKLATVARQFLDDIRSHGLPPETVRTIDRLLVQTRQSHQK